MSIDAAIAIAWDVFKSVVAPIKRQFGYVIYSKRRADDLQEKVRELANEVDRVYILAQRARNNVRIFFGEFTEWEASAGKDLKEAQDLLRDFQEASKSCCYETLPDPKCRYQFSRKAKDKIEVIQRLTQRSSGFKELNDISSSNPASGNIAALTPAKDNGVFESRASIIRDIMDALADDSNSVVGVHGMGGVGKSTLLADVKGRMIEKKSFDWVAKADVSENPDIKNIQGEIADALSLTEIKNKETTSGRAELLHKRLENEEREKKKVLIILDNLWKGLDLKSVGIPCGHDNKVKGCKLLLTSRFQNVLQREMGCDRDFRLDKLKEEEAKSLFERTVGDKVNDDPFKSLVDEALRKCAGLPFLIIAMAKLFKHANFSQWEDALKQIEMSTNKGISEKINKMLQLSYDYIEGEEGKEVKQFLRLCVVYGVSKPSLENLVRYGIGLRLFGENSSIKEARNRLSSLIQTLQASSLLLDDEDADSFKIHDLVRGFVASVASRGDPFLVWKDNDKSVTGLPKDKLKSCTAVCFPYVDIKELPKELDCPEMQIFLLFANNESLKVPDSYFNSMRKLMVLHLSQICLSHSPSPFQFLENLHTLCLHGCSLDDVAMIGELKWLHILSFVNSKIGRLPKEIGQLVELRLLDLNHCSRLKIIEPGVLGSLTKLEELYMENSFVGWNAVKQTSPTNAKLIELNNLKNLYTLHVSIPNPSRLPEDLNVEKLTKFKIQIGAAWNWPKHKGSSTLHVKLDPISNILQKGFMQTFLGKTNDLFLDGSNGIEQSICKLSQEGFPKLQHLHVENSPSIHYVLQSPSHTDFKTLESLLLKNLINLEKICNYSISSKSESFSALKVIRVESCDKMEILFPLSLLRELPQLEEVRALKCNLVRVIVEVDDCGKVELHNLQVLELRDLPNTKNFFSTGTAPSSSTSIDQVGSQVAFFNEQQVSIPSLESLTMAGLPNLEDLWTDESPLGLSNLQFLEVSSCKSLSKVINSRSLIKLQKLHTLNVKDCILVQEIFDLDGAGVNIETLSKLNTIYINGLPNLICVWNKNPRGIVRFHNLKKLEVYDCDNLRFLFFQSMVQSLAQLRELEVCSCKNMEAIIMEEEGLRVETLETLVFPMLTKLNLERLESLTCFSHRNCTPKAQGEDNVKLHSPILFNQKVSIPSLESLKMAKLPNLENIWINESLLGLSNLQFLEVLSCKSFSKVINSKSLAELHKLHTLRVEDCISVQEIFDLDGLNANANIETFSKLDTIDIRGLPGLRCVWNKNPREIVRFHNLKKLEAYGCNNLEFLFFPSMVQSLAQLRYLSVFDCEKMMAIIMEEEGLRIETSETVEFPMLTSLVFGRLESLTCFSCKKCTSEARGEDRVKSHSTILFNQEVAFPSLEALWIHDMDNIEIIWDNQVAANSFHKLKVLKVLECNKLLNIVPSCILGRLRSLECLEVQSCNSLEVVFKLQPLNPPDGHNDAHLPLKRLELDRLPKLKCVWDKDLHSQVKFQVKFQCLHSVTVYECKSLAYLFPTSVATHLIELNELKIDECGIVELIEKEDKSVHRFVFPKLIYLKLAHLTELKCIYIGKHASHWPALKKLKVLDCDKVEIFASHLENEMPLHKQPLFSIDKGAFPNLQKLKLDLSRRMEIWHGHFHDGEFFTKLRVLELHNFSKELAIFTCCFVQSLANLEKLIVRKSTRKVLNVSIEAIVCPSHELEVILPSSFQHLKILKLLDCDGLSPYEILPLSTFFQHLGTLDMSSCDGLSNIFTLTIARNLEELTKLKISNCKMLTEVICDEEGEEGLMVAFNQLRYIELDGLIKLRCFSSIKYTLVFPLLEDVIVSRCPDIKFFSGGPIEAPKLDRVQVSTKEWFWKENLNITIQNMFEESEMVAREGFMRLS